MPHSYVTELGYRAKCAVCPAVGPLGTAENAWPQAKHDGWIDIGVNCNAFLCPKHASEWLLEAEKKIEAKKQESHKHGGKRS